MKLYDLHTHTTHSDGELIPSESARRAKYAGYAGIAITDHADSSNILSLLKANLSFKEVFNKSSSDFSVIVGVELTHVSPKDIAYLTELARDNGADIVIVHGETIVEPVEAGTNIAAIKAKVDILAHPGLILLDEAKLATDNNVALEITTRRGHGYTNAHVAKQAKLADTRLVINNDAHCPNDFVGIDMAKKILLGASLNIQEVELVMAENAKIFENKYKN